MKKILLLAFMTLAIAAADAQKMDAAAVPSNVKASFEKKYAGITAKWEKEVGNYEAGFKKDGVEMSVVIEPGGKIIETEMEIKVAKLPESSLSYLKQHYKGKTVTEASKITKSDGTVNYEAEINDTDVMFDANGKFLKETKDKEDKED